MAARWRPLALELPSLLITDDDRDFRETLRGVFEPRGFRTTLAADGREGLEFVRQSNFHLLLVDMHMPRMTGLEMVRRLRELHSNIPCILLSAALDEDICKQARQIEVTSVLSKPVTFLQLTGIVGQVMRERYGWTPPALSGGN